jgi:hypothetical protein
MIDFASTSAAILKYFPPICTVQYSSPFTCPQGWASRMMVKIVPLLNFSVLSRSSSSVPTCSPMMLSRVSSKILFTSVQGGQAKTEKRNFYNSSVGHSFGNRSAARSLMLSGWVARYFACSIVRVTDIGLSSPGYSTVMPTLSLTRQ